ncbi:DMT family transporter [Actinomadura graeca]|uniref:DMT family transporter n=1 Tax=Actinomadura graeca TaxID=2750812 RepID=A0ABX8QUC5_9ACTN|nr:DMT family transporter [Actinomadura graeca]QXJ22409.1 DMT family transporter [Actinomadura graeca]
MPKRGTITAAHGRDRDRDGSARSVPGRLRDVTTRRPVPSLIAGAVCVALSSVFIPLAGTSTGTITFFRGLLSMPVLIPLAVSERRRPQPPRPRRSRPMALLAGVMLAGDILLWNEGIANSGAGIATVIVNAQVVLVPLLGWIFLRERPGRMFAAIVPVMLAGVALAGGLVGEGASGDDPVLGAVYSAAAALCYAAFLFLLRQAGDADRIIVPVTESAAVSGLVALLVGPFWHGLDLAPGWAPFGWLLGIALTGQVASYLLIGGALPHLPAEVGAALLLIQPVGSVLLGALILGERPTPLQLLGCAVVLLALYLATVTSGKGAKREDEASRR